MPFIVVVFLIAFSAFASPARADSWGSLATISAEPTAGYICAGASNGYDILCASPGPSLDASGNVNIGTTSTGYLNFGGTLGTGGYGIRSNAGAIEFKNSAGAWTGLAGLASQWVTSGSNIYYNSGNVGIGTASPASALSVVGDITASSRIAINDPLLAGYTFQNSGKSLFRDDIVSTNGIIRNNNYGAYTYLSFASGDTGWSFYTTNTARNAGLQRLNISGAGDISNFSILNSNVGIGTTAPSGKLQVQADSTTTNAAVYGIYLNGAQSAANTSSYYGVAAAPTFSGSAVTLAGQVGLLAYPQNSGTGTVTALYGLQAIPTKSGTGPVTNMYGVYSRCDNTNATGAVTNCYALYLDTPTATGAITNKYGVYQADANSSNYFAGNVGIGTVSPGAKLQVSTGADSTIGQIIKANTASQSADLQQWQDSSANVLAKINSGGIFTLHANPGLSSTIVTVGNAAQNVPALDITGYFVATGAIKIHNNNSFTDQVQLGGTSGLVASPMDAGQVAIIAKGYSGQTGNIQEWQNSGGSVLANITAAGGGYFAGNVGIGTAAPGEKLQVLGNIKVSGTIQVADTSTACTTAADYGKIRYNTTTNKFQICKP